MTVNNNTPNIRFNGFSGDWVEKKLGDIANFSKGKSLSKADISKHGMHACIHYGELFTEYGRCIDKVRSLTNLSMNSSTLSKVNDVLMPTSDVTPNGLAKASAIDIPDVILGGDILVVRSDEILNSFFAYYVEGNQKDVIELTTGTTVYHIYGKDLARLNISIPLDKSEQIPIGQFLQHLDQTIALSRRKYEKTKTLKKSFLSKMFPQAGKNQPDIRLKGFSGDWVEKVLGDIASFSKGKGLPKADINTSGANPCIHYGELFTEYGRCIDKVRSLTNLSMNSSTLSKVNDVLMPTSDVTPNGLAKASAIDIPDVILGGDILIIRSDEILNSFFAYYVEGNQKDIIELTTGTTVYHIYGKDLARLRLLIPPNKSEQIAITNLLKGIDDTLGLQSKQLKALENLKKALLAKMFV